MDHATEILEKISEVRETVVRIDERQTANAEQVDEHHRSLYGNGKPGLVSQVQTLEDSRKLLCWALGVACTAVGTLLGAAITKYWGG